MTYINTQRKEHFNIPLCSASLLYQNELSKEMKPKQSKIQLPTFPLLPYSHCLPPKDKFRRQPNLPHNPQTSLKEYEYLRNGQSGALISRIIEKLESFKKQTELKQVLTSIRNIMKGQIQVNMHWLAERLLPAITRTLKTIKDPNFNLSVLRIVTKMMDFWTLGQEQIKIINAKAVPFIAKQLQDLSLQKNVRTYLKLMSVLVEHHSTIKDRFIEKKAVIKFFSKPSKPYSQIQTQELYINTLAILCLGNSISPYVERLVNHLINFIKQNQIPDSFSIETFNNLKWFAFQYINYQEQDKCIELLSIIYKLYWKNHSKYGIQDFSDPFQYIFRKIFNHYIRKERSSESAKIIIAHLYGGCYSYVSFFDNNRPIIYNIFRQYTDQMYSELFREVTQNQIQISQYCLIKPCLQAFYILVTYDQEKTQYKQAALIFLNELYRQITNKIKLEKDKYWKKIVNPQLCRKLLSINSHNIFDKLRASKNDQIAELASKTLIQFQNLKNQKKNAMAVKNNNNDTKINSQMSEHSGEILPSPSKITFSEDQNSMDVERQGTHFFSKQYKKFEQTGKQPLLEQLKHLKKDQIRKNIKKIVVDLLKIPQTQLTMNYLKKIQTIIDSQYKTHINEMTKTLIPKIISIIQTFSKKELLCCCLKVITCLLPFHLLLYKEIQVIKKKCVPFICENLKEKNVIEAVICLADLFQEIKNQFIKKQVIIQLLKPLSFSSSFEIKRLHALTILCLGNSVKHPSVMSAVQYILTYLQNGQISRQMNVKTLNDFQLFAFQYLNYKDADQCLRLLNIFQKICIKDCYKNQRNQEPFRQFFRKIFFEYYPRCDNLSEAEQKVIAHIYVGCYDEKQLINLNPLKVQALFRQFSDEIYIKFFWASLFQSLQVTKQCLKHPCLKAFSILSFKNEEKLELMNNALLFLRQLYYQCGKKLQNRQSDSSVTVEKNLLKELLSVERQIVLKELRSFKNKQIADMAQTVINLFKSLQKEVEKNVKSNEKK